MYMLRPAEVEALSEEKFLLWRTRFLRWVEIHCPGQSKVALFAKLSNEEFEKMLGEARDLGKFPPGASGFGLGFTQHFIKSGIGALDKWTGIKLRYPKYLPGKAQATIADVKKNSAADKAGLKPGMTVVRVENTDIREWDDLIFMLAGYQDGSTVKLIVRDGDSDKTQENYLLLGPR